MDRHNIEELLEQMGRTPIADPDELTVARIEQRWRSVAEGSTDTSASRSRSVRGQSVGQTRRPSRRVAVSGATALIGVAASVALIVAVQGRTNDSDHTVVADATDVVVVLPNGETIEPLAGEQLPDGAVIEAGDAASGEIGAVAVSPRARYVVRNGTIEPYGGVAATIPRSSNPVVDTTVRSTTAVTGGNGAGTPSTQVAEPQGPTTQPKTTTPGSGVRPARLNVRALAEPKPNGKGTRVQIAWTKTDRPEVRRYVVIRVRSWNGRTLPAGKRIANVRAGTRQVAIDRNPKDGTFYVVAAIGPGNRVIAIGSVEAPVSPA